MTQMHILYVFLIVLSDVPSFPLDTNLHDDTMTDINTESGVGRTANGIMGQAASCPTNGVDEVR